MEKRSIQCYDREQLHKEIWKEPMCVVAKRYNISNVALRKICRKLQVPTPYNGYWAKIRAGIEAEKLPLPIIDFPIDFVSVQEKKLGFLSKKRRQEILGICDSIQIPTELQEPSNLLQDNIYYYNELIADPPQDEHLLFSKPSYRGISVTTPYYKKAIIIIDVIIKALSSLGYKVKLINYNRFGVVIEKETIIFWIYETRKQAPKTNQQQTKQPPYGSSTLDYNYISMGKLFLHIESHSARHQRWLINDKHLKKLLGDFIIELIATSNEIKIDREKKIEEEKRYREEETRRRELKELQENENKRLMNLECLVSDWDKACSIREYARALEQSIKVKSIPQNKKNKIYKWITWAKRKADWLDPFVGYEDPLLGKKHPFPYTNSKE